ncbi:hypothetical protein LSAT2_026672, partial [Lamellibrachia satsuma]
ISQKPTTTTADQPLHSRGNELVWANPKFENVIFLVGGFHVCFNCLKAIGQHTDCTDTQLINAPGVTSWQFYFCELQLFR